MFVKTKERKQGIIRDFPELSDESLSLMAEDLGLYMSLQELKYCAAQMKSDKIKDITLDELYILDSICSSANYYPDKIGIDSFNTDSEAVAQTYTDFIKRRHELDGGRNLPLNLSAFLSTASEYLYKSGKKLSLLPTFATSVEKSELIRLCSGISYDQDSLDLTSYGGDMTSSFGIYKKTAPFRKVKEADGNLLAVVIPHDGESMEEYNKKCLAFLNDSLMHDTVCNPEVTSDMGIIERISRYRSGFDVNMKKYPQDALQMCFADYAASLKGILNFIITPSDIKNVSQTAKKMNIRVFSIGTVTSTGYLKIINGDAVSASLKTSLLSSVSMRSSNTVTINCVGGQSETFVEPSAVCQRKKVSLLVREYINDSFSNLGMITSVGFCRLNKCPFLSSLYSSLAPVTKLVCAGADWRGISISCDIQLDDCKDSEALSRNAAAFLGLYRVQAELSVISSGSKVNFGENSAESGNITVYASAKMPQNIIGDTIVSSDNDIYLITFDIDGGMPDFEKLKKSFDIYSKLIKEGKIVSARAVAGMNIVQTVRQMCPNNINVEFDSEFADSDYKLSLAIIAEAREPIEGMKIGKTVLNAPADLTDCAEAEQSTDNSDIISNIYFPDVNAAFVCFGEKTREQHILEEMFANSGVSVHTICGTCDRQTLNQISSEMRRCCITVFCGDGESVKTALNDVRIKFACDEYSAQGKLLISYGYDAGKEFASAFGIKISPCGFGEISGEDKLHVFSTNSSSPFSRAAYSFNCTLISEKCLAVKSGCESLFKAECGGVVFSDGFLSDDKCKAAFFSVITDEAVESAVEYFK